MRLSTKDQDAIANLLTEMSNGDFQTRTGENQNKTSSIIYKNEGGPMGGAKVAALEKFLRTSMGKRYKGSVTKGYGTTELVFYGEGDEAQSYIDRFMRNNPPTEKGNYSLSVGGNSSQTTSIGRHVDPETGLSGNLYR
jgi:hypothetical protein|tara:strand:- start:1286 stop:1699 length:414 start_codon:yes stop_codon:yes gene_type:complete